MLRENPVVAIIMGSQSDWNIMQHAQATLDDLKIPSNAFVMSAHRTPERLSEFVTSAKTNGFRVIIAGAGMAAALPGAAAALTPLPVLGVPMEGKIAGGLDALLSMTQMPAGVPVGTLAVGRSGAVNAALLAASILALSNRDISDSLDKFRKNQTESVLETPGDDN